MVVALVGFAWEEKKRANEREGRKKECVATVVATAVQQQQGFTKEEVGGGAPLKLPFEKGFFLSSFSRSVGLEVDFQMSILRNGPWYTARTRATKPSRGFFSRCRKKHETQATRRAKKDR